MQFIPRPIYIDKLVPYIGKQLIKVLVGQRRVGKSYLLFQIQDLIRKRNPKTQIIYINKELFEFSHIRNARNLYDHLQTLLNPEKHAAIFIDEIQDIEDFELALRDLNNRPNLDIYCTGSNANLLSSELATYLSGRYIEIKVFGLSYSEFLEFHKADDSILTFEKYLKFGGLPFLVNLELEPAIANGYLGSIYNTILLKDVVARYNIRNVPFLERLVAFLADNTGSLVSSKRISDYLKSQKINISPQVVIDYLGYLEASFMVFKVNRADIEGRQIFEIGEKYFFEDIGIRNMIVGFKTTDIHKIMENIVALHLKMAGYKINVGLEGKREVDFIGEKSGEKIYVQVAYMLASQETVSREFEVLLSIPDNFPKYVVTMDMISDIGSYKGIQRVHVKDFCRTLI